MTAIRRTVFWLRGDLRVDDNPALHAASGGEGDRCTAIFLLDDPFWSRHHWGPARRGMALRAVAAMRTRLAEAGIDLRVLEPSGASIPDVLAAACAALDATEVHAGREFGVDEARRHVRLAREARDVVDVARRFGNDIRFEEDPVLGGLRHERSIGLRPFAAFDMRAEIRCPGRASTPTGTRFMMSCQSCH